MTGFQGLDYYPSIPSDEIRMANMGNLGYHPRRADIGNADSGKPARVAIWLGGLSAIAGAAVLLGYGLVRLSRDFFGSPDVPLPIQIAVPALAVGILVILVGVLAERLHRRKQDQLEGVEY